MMYLKKAIQALEKKGILLVFPIRNAKNPPSLWYEFFPKTKMRWEWDDSGDSRLGDLWRLKDELSSSGKVVYTKWYKNSATFLSFECFEALYKLLSDKDFYQNPSTQSLKIHQRLLENSPVSSKTLRKEFKENQGWKSNLLDKYLKDLWQRLWIVGYGEVDDGAFPSLALAASSLMFEAQVKKASKLKSKEALSILEKRLGKDSLFLTQLHKIQWSKMPDRIEKRSNALSFEDLQDRK